MLGLLLPAICLALVAYKFLLVSRLNISWDEFLYLSNVYALERGELRLFLQGAYTHLFGWLTRWPGDEIAQVNVGRMAMLILLGASAALIWRLAGRWLEGVARAVPPLVYLSSMPVLLHGGAFRADSILVFLLMLALTAIVGPPGRAGRDWLAGAAIGAAFALTVKAVIFLPLFVVLLCLRTREVAASGRYWPTVTKAASRVMLAAGLTAALLLGAHWLTMPAGIVESLPDYGARVARKALFDVPWFARADYLEMFARLQPLPWLLIATGALLAALRRRFDLAGLVLALLPVAIYRNAFAYFYVVMLAPLCILAGFALREIRAAIAARAGSNAALGFVALICLGLLYQGLHGLGRLREDEQVSQRQLVAAVHRIFPEPVNYVGRCGMIASFRRVNFFMSTWGLESYRERGIPFMPAAIRSAKPAFVLVNSQALDPERGAGNGLLPGDRDLIARFYPPYWGPLRVAGAQAVLRGADAVRLSVPFPGDYRLVSAAAVAVDGVLQQPGDVVPVSDRGVTVRLRDPGSDEGILVSLFLASARSPPQQPFASAPLFTSQ